jgi:dsRNA-gated channel SID-1
MTSNYFSLPQTQGAVVSFNINNSSAIAREQFLEGHLTRTSTSSTEVRRLKHPPSYRVPQYLSFARDALTDEHSLDDLPTSYALDYGRGLVETATCTYSRIDIGVCPPVTSGLTGNQTFLLDSRQVGIGASEWNYTVAMYDAQIPFESSATGEVFCGSIKYHYVVIPSSAENVIINVEQSDPAVCSSALDEVCPFAAAFVSYDACPNRNTFDFRQTFTTRASFAMSRSADLQSGMYVIGVAADIFSAQFEDSDIRNAATLVRVKNRRCCSRPFKYRITITSTGVAHDSLFSFLLINGIFLAVFFLLLGIAFYSISYYQLDKSSDTLSTVRSLLAKAPLFGTGGSKSHSRHSFSNHDEATDDFEMARSSGLDNVAGTSHTVCNAEDYKNDEQHNDTLLTKATSSSTVTHSDKSKYSSHKGFAQTDEKAHQSTVANSTSGLIRSLSVDSHTLNLQQSGSDTVVMHAISGPQKHDESPNSGELLESSLQILNDPDAIVQADEEQRAHSHGKDIKIHMSEKEMAEAFLRDMDPDAIVQVDEEQRVHSHGEDINLSEKEMAEAFLRDMETKDALGADTEPSVPVRTDRRTGILTFDYDMNEPHIVQAFQLPGILSARVPKQGSTRPRHFRRPRSDRVTSSAGALDVAAEPSVQLNQMQQRRPKRRDNMRRHQWQPKPNYTNKFRGDREMFITAITDSARVADYWFVLMIVGLVTLIPAGMWSVTTMVEDRSVMERCHQNYLCQRNVNWFGHVQIRGINHVLSCVPYLFVAAFIVVYVKFFERYRRRRGGAKYELSSDRNLFYAIAVSIFLAGIYSSTYHFCPTELSFMLDTMFLLFFSGTCFVALYRRRHGIFIIRPLNFFIAFAVLVFFNGLGTLLRWNDRMILFWLVFIPVAMLASMLGSLRLYYYKHTYRYTLSIVVRNISMADFKPRRRSRFVFLSLLTLYNWSVILSCVVTGYDTSIMLLLLSFGDFILYIAFYMWMKIKYSKDYPAESPRPYVIILFVSLLACTGWAAYLFANDPTEKSLPLHVSRELNASCTFLAVDRHDLWHILTAIIMALMSLILFHVDDGMKLHEAHVF